MGELTSNPDDSERSPYGAPAFFKYVWNPDNVQGSGHTYIAPGPVAIWGFSHKSTYAEDARVERSAWQYNRAFPGMCFSVLTPEGEYGFSHMSNGIEEISRDEFEAARARGWRP